MSISINAQVESIAESLKSKDLTAISRNLADEIDLCVMDDTQINTKEEAIIRIRKFIESNPIQSIETLHKGTSDSKGSSYNVYKISTTDKVIRAFVYYENDGGKQLIKEIRFDKF